MIGPRLFYRHPTRTLRSDRDNSDVKVNHLSWWQPNTLDYRIVFETTRATQSAFRSFREHAIHVPRNDNYIPRRVVPESLWDPECRAFLRPVTHHSHFFPKLLIMTFAKDSESDETVVLCETDHDGNPQVGVVAAESMGQFRTLLHKEEYREESISRSHTEDKRLSLYKRNDFRVHWMPQDDVQMDVSGHDIVVLGNAYTLFQVCKYVVFKYHPTVGMLALKNDIDERS
ncbi:hypothetical protein Q7P37_000700 [Cladosporium fusiforme]